MPPNCPAETWAFWITMAACTSEGVSLKLLSFVGSSQMRMAYWAPKTCTSPTPVTRDSGSCTEATRKSERSSRVNPSSLETKPSTMRKLRADFATCTPCCCTATGSRGSASCSLFCVCTCAMSGSVPASKVSVTVAWP